MGLYRIRREEVDQRDTMFVIDHAEPPFHISDPPIQGKAEAVRLAFEAAEGLPAVLIVDNARRDGVWRILKERG